MRLMILASFVFAMSAAACDSNGSAPTSDAGDVLSVGEVTSDQQPGPGYPGGPETIPCDELESEFAGFVEANNQCETVADCILVGGTRSCDCAPSLGNGSGTGLNHSASNEAKHFIERYFSAECKPIQTEECDTDKGDLECVDGRCRVGIVNCMSLSP